MFAMYKMLLINIIFCFCIGVFEAGGAETDSDTCYLPEAAPEASRESQPLWTAWDSVPANGVYHIVRVEASGNHTLYVIVNLFVLLLVISVTVYILRNFLLKTEKRNEVLSELTIRSVNELKDAVNELKNSHDDLSREGQDAYEEFKRTVCDVVDGRMQELIKELSKMKPARAPKQSVPDKISYDAAVDAWIYINDHLSTLGRDRFKIPHVYAFLGGSHVEASELKADLASLNEARREEVNTIIGDIKLFNSKHLASIESWLSSLSDDVKTLRDAVRFPLGQPFDNELDEHLLGDTIEDGETITKVASLGYLFPGSLNGSYRVKSKVLVQSD